MRTALVWAGVLALGLGASPTRAEEAAAVEVKKLTPDECVEIALRESGTVAEAAGKVSEWAGRLAEVQSVWYPKLIGMTYVAPLYRVIGDASTRDVQRDFSQWGPYFALKAILAQPVYTFGRAAAGEKAAAERLEVEKAQLESTRNLVALEVRKLYYLTLFARSMQPALNSAGRILDEAENSAKELYEKGSGGVTNVDLMKLRYGKTELEKFRVQADIGAQLGLAALKHTMGLPQNAAVDLVDEMLPDAPEAPLAPLPTYIAEAWKSRPEVKQMLHGTQAAMSFEEAERLSSMPLVFVAGQLDLNWTQMWPDLPNPFHWDRFNDITPAIAFGLQFDVDIAKSMARTKTAHAVVEQVEGLKKFAQTGIPMQVRKAYDDAVQAKKLVELSDEGSTAGRKWMVFAGSAYLAGTGEAKDLLEGLVAYLSSKQSYYANLQALHVARAELAYATGSTGLALPAPNP